MTKDELKSIIAEERTQYLGAERRKIRYARSDGQKRYCIWQAVKYFRAGQFYNEKRLSKDTGALDRYLSRALFRYYDRRRNIAGAEAGVEIALSSKVGRGVDIWHGGVVINGDLGENCVLHGNNVIGNKGKKDRDGTPSIGAGCDIGAGAVLIGDIELADGCTVGAGAVVTRSFPEEGSVLAGVPAKVLHRKGE